MFVFRKFLCTYSMDDPKWLFVFIFCRIFLFCFDILNVWFCSYSFRRDEIAWLFGIFVHTSCCDNVCYLTTSFPDIALEIQQVANTVLSRKSRSSKGSIYSGVGSRGFHLNLSVFQLLLEFLDSCTKSFPIVMKERSKLNDKPKNKS